MQNSTKSIEQQYSRIQGNMIVATDGILTAGCPIPDDLAICVKTKMLISALEQCGEDLSLTLLADNSLFVKSGEFSAQVETLPVETIPQIFADAPSRMIPENLIWALDSAGEVARANSTKLALSTVLVYSGSCIGTSGRVIVQTWFGDMSLPTMIVPCGFIRALGKAHSKPYRMGLSDDSLTIWFEDGSWLKTMLYPADSRLPNYSEVLDRRGAEWAVALSPNLFDAAKRLKKAKARKLFFVDEDIVASETGLRLTVSNLCGGPLTLGYEIDDLLAIEKMATHISWISQAHEPTSKVGTQISLWFGTNVRGAIVSTHAGEN